MPDPATNSSNKEFRLLAASVLYFLSRAAVVGFVFAVPALYFLRGFVEMPLVLGGAGLVAVLFGSYYLLARGLRCGACSNPVLMDNGTRKHPHARRIPGLSLRARVAWDILFHTNYHCLYCNTRCRSKKSWSAGTPQPAFPNAGRPGPHVSTAAAGGFPEAVFSSIFGGVAAEPAVEKSRTERFPGVTEEERTHEHAEKLVMVASAGRAVKAPPVTERSHDEPSARTVPVTVESTDQPKESKTATKPVPEAITISSGVELPAGIKPPGKQPLPWEMPAQRHPGSDPKPAAAGQRTAPENGTKESTNETTAMNSSQPDRSSTSLPSNPFLAAAAAQPPPPSPGLPARKATRPNGEESPQAPAFPAADLSEPHDGPPPWTLPSVQRPAPVVTAPVLPIIPDTAASLARRPQMTTSTVRPAPPAAPRAQADAGRAPAPGLVAPSAPGAMPPALIRDVVEVLEEGQRSLSAAFHTIIQKLENRLSASAPAVAPGPLPIPPAAPILPPAPGEAAAASPAPAFELPAAFPPSAAPEYGTPPPAAASQQPFLPPRAAVAPQAYAPTPAPAPVPVPAPAAPPPEAAPARRRFARPNGAAAQSLSETLAGAFGANEAPALQPNTNGRPAHAQPAGFAPMESPFALAEPPANGVRPPAFPQAPFTPPPVGSPFALADNTLTQAAAPAAPQPAPFTFLQPLGDHFAPIGGAPVPAPAAAPAPAPAPAPYDALEDTPMPWMQPVGGRR